MVPRTIHRSSVGVLSEEVRAHNPTPPSTALVARVDVIGGFKILWALGTPPIVLT